MARTLAHPIRALLSVVDGRGRRALAWAAMAQCGERLALTAAAVLVAVDGARRAGLVAVGLAAVFLVRSALRAGLRTYVRARALEAITSALLAQTLGLTEAMTEETEIALVDGMYAAEEILGLRVVELLGDVPACALLTAFVVWRGPTTLVLEGAAAVSFGALAALAARRVTIGTATAVWEALRPAMEDLSTAIYARLEIAANGEDGPFLRELRAKLSAWERRSRGGARVSFLAGRAPVVGAAVVVGAFFLWQGGWRGEQLASVAILASVTPAFAGLARTTLEMSRDLVRARPFVACLEEARTAPTGGDRGVALPAVITWEQVSFVYPGQSSPSVSRVSVTWAPGETLGVLGQNGSGKSTFLRLLLGFARPSQGRLTIGGNSVEDLDGGALRRSIGYLPQRPFLPDRMTVAEAIHLLAPGAAAAAMEATLTSLELWPVLARRHPDAPLDVRLGTLSAGQKQRVAVARVLLRDAPLLLLDEPDANLDAQGIAIVARLLREEAKKRMVLVVAHSEALLQHADRIVVFEDGRARVEEDAQVSAT